MTSSVFLCNRSLYRPSWMSLRCLKSTLKETPLEAWSQASGGADLCLEVKSSIKMFKMFDKYCSNMILIYIPLIANWYESLEGKQFTINIVENIIAIFCWSPMVRRAWRAIRWCKPQCSTEMATCVKEEEENCNMPMIIITIITIIIMPSCPPVQKKMKKMAILIQITHCIGRNDQNHHCWINACRLLP